jgi:hypothetical protein
MTTKTAFEKLGHTEDFGKAGLLSEIKGVSPESQIKGVAPVSSWHKYNQFDMEAKEGRNL